MIDYTKQALILTGKLSYYTLTFLVFEKFSEYYRIFQISEFYEIID